MNLLRSDRLGKGSYALLLAFGLQGQGFAQVPETDLWLFKIEKKENTYTAVNPLNITNRAGYDNQPAFTADGKSILYASIREDSQADIYRYDIKSKLHTNLTKSKVSEYSPTVLPDESGFSAVVVEPDSAQRVWIIGFDGSFMRFASDVTDSVGYHSWLNTDTMLYYKLTEPHSLHSLNTKNGRDVWICDHPSRAFKKIQGSSNFIYAIKNVTFMEFRIYQTALKESKVYATYPSVNEDFIWHPELGLIKAENADLLRYNESTKQWETLFSFGAVGIKKITRFGFDAKTKQLIIVNNL
jgi:hypothetical protein